jgi:hypothetical protein
MDYTSLAADIPVRLMAENKKWPDEIANTIAKAQRRLLDSLHPDALRQLIEGQISLVTDGEEGEGGEPPLYDGVIDLTAVDHFGEIISVWVRVTGSRLRTLLPRTFDFCTALFGTMHEFTNDLLVPKYYAEKTPGLYVTFPRPSQEFPFKGIANLRCPPIAPGGPSTNLLTDRYPELLEYACCIEGAMWMKDSPAIQIWQAAFDDRLRVVNDNVRRRRRDESTVIQRNTENAAGAP